MTPEWQAWVDEQKRKAERIIRMWSFAALLLASTVGYAHLFLRFGHMDPSSVLPLVLAMPLGVATAMGVFWFLFVRGRP